MPDKTISVGARIAYDLNDRIEKQCKALEKSKNAWVESAIFDKLGLFDVYKKLEESFAECDAALEERDAARKIIEAYRRQTFWERLIGVDPEK